LSHPPRYTTYGHKDVSRDYSTMQYRQSTRQTTRQDMQKHEQVSTFIKASQPFSV